jgi:uncharacterized protein YprB with RNaseH-like and TPR domain
MLTHSFLHLPGIGETTEQRLWDSGVRSWDDLESSLDGVFGKKKASSVAAALDESRAAFESGEYKYFAERMKGAHMWRLVPECADSIAYLDIETTGLGFPPMSESTTIAILFKGEIFVEHTAKKKRELLERIQNEAKMVVTFNGLCFDMPFLRHETELPLALLHVDLRVWFRRHGLTGGLKAIQRACPDVHQRSSMDIDGFDAVRLWRMHKRGVPRALETLMTYNAEDSLVLEPLLYLAYEREKSRMSHLPMRDLPAAGALPKLATEVDSFVYGLLRGQESWNVPEGW